MDNNSNRSASVQQVSLLAGAGALIIYGLMRRSKTSLALAAAGSLGAVWQARSFAATTAPPATSVFRVNASAAEAYKLWRNLETLPHFMAHLQSVRVLDDRRSDWVATGPFGTKVQWTAEITEDTPEKRLAWRSIAGSVITTSGWVEFQNDRAGRGSYVRALIEYTNPAGVAGHAALTILGKNPNFVVKEDLRRFKALLEAGEAPTTLGQTHGPRGLSGRTKEVLFRETSNHPTPQSAGAGRERSAVA